MKLALVAKEPEQAVLHMPNELDFNSWLNLLSTLGVPQDALKLDRLKSLHDLEEKPLGEHLIATGLDPIDEGVEAKLHFQTKKTQTDDDDNQADFFNLGFGVDVVEGQLLAEQISHGPGKDGHDAVGKRLPFSVFSNEKPLTYNSNVTIEKEGKITRFYSKINGVLYNDKLDVLDVEPVFTIKSAVGYNTGNLSVAVDIDIDGDVKAGFAVRSGKNITIRGVVEKGAIIEADGNIVIEGGVSPNTLLKAQGDIQLKFAQGSQLYASGDVHVSSYIYDSFVLAQKSFHCTGAGSDSRGAVIGGLINGLDSIHVASVGSQNNVTTLVTGIHYQRREEYRDLLKLKNTLEEEVKRLIRLLPLDLLDPKFKANLHALPEQERKICLQKIKQIISHREECGVIGSRISALEPDTMPQNPEAHIEVSKAVFPDLKIIIGNDYKLLQKKLGAVKFNLVEGKINLKNKAETHK